MSPSQRALLLHLVQLLRNQEHQRGKEPQVTISALARRVKIGRACMRRRLRVLEKTLIEETLQEPLQQVS